MVDLRGIEPLIPACKAGVLPLALQTHKPQMHVASPQPLDSCFTPWGRNWCLRLDSNQLPAGYESAAHPYELHRQENNMVSHKGFEPSLLDP